MEVTLKISDNKEIKLPIDEKNFDCEKPIVVKFINKRGKVKHYTLRLTTKLGLVFN